MTYLMNHDSLVALVLVSFITFFALLLFILGICQVIKLAESPLTLNVIGKRWRWRGTCCEGCLTPKTCRYFHSCIVERNKEARDG